MTQSPLKHSVDACQCIFAFLHLCNILQQNWQGNMAECGKTGIVGLCIFTLEKIVQYFTIKLARQYGQLEKLALLDFTSLF